MTPLVLINASFKIAVQIIFVIKFLKKFKKINGCPRNSYNIYMKLDSIQTAWLLLCENFVDCIAWETARILNLKIISVLFSKDFVLSFSQYLQKEKYYCL